MAKHNPDYRGVAYAGGGSLASIGSAMIGGGMAQDERNLAQNAKKRALDIEEANSDIHRKSFDLNSKNFDLNSKKYEDVRMDLEKAESKQEATKKSNINAMRNLLEQSYKIDTSKMSDDDIHFNGERLEAIYKDKTSRQTPKFFSTSAGVVAAYEDENGKPITKIVFATRPKEGSQEESFRKWHEDKIQIPAERASEFNDVQTYENIKGSGYWVSKKDFAENEMAQKIGNNEAKFPKEK